MDVEEVVESGQPVVLFDGECSLCTGVVRFIVERDSDKVFRFAPLQSGLGEKLLEREGMETDSYSTFVLVEGGTVYTRSAAALHLLEHLGTGWRLVAELLKLVPGPVRDFFYGLVARSRYRVFGRKESCMVPDEELKERFLDW